MIDEIQEGKIAAGEVKKLMPQTHENLQAATEILQILEGHHLSVWQAKKVLAFCDTMAEQMSDITINGRLMATKRFVLYSPSVEVPDPITSK